MFARLSLAIIVFGLATACGSSAATSTAAASDTAASDASDTAVDAATDASATCPAKATVCCCKGDTVAPALCQAGAWQCGVGYYSYQATDCGVLPVGGPCGGPGPAPDAVSDTAADTTQDAEQDADTAAPDAAVLDTAPADDTSTADSAADDAAPGNPCTATGGSVSEGLCCQSAGDFPSSCAVGACGCAPSYSHTVKVCNCPGGKCFDPAVGCKAM